MAIGCDGLERASSRRKFKIYRILLKKRIFYLAKEYINHFPISMIKYCDYIQLQKAEFNWAYYRVMSSSRGKSLKQEPDILAGNMSRSHVKQKHEVEKAN